MDFLSKAYGQLVDLFKSMTPGARISAALLLTMVVVSLAYLLNHTSGGQGALLMGGESFNANQLAQIQAAFGKANLHDARVEGSQIRVPVGKEATYMAAMAA